MVLLLLLLLLLLLVVSTGTAQVAAVGLEAHVLGDVPMRLPTEGGQNLRGQWLTTILIGVDPRLLLLLCRPHLVIGERALNGGQQQLRHVRVLVDALVDVLNHLRQPPAAVVGVGNIVAVGSHSRQRDLTEAGQGRTELTLLKGVQIVVVLLLLLIKANGGLRLGEMLAGRHALSSLAATPHQLTAATANQRLVGGGRAGGGGRLALQLTSIAAASLNSSEKFIEVQQRGSGRWATSSGIPCPQIGGSWLLHVQVLLREVVLLLLLELRVMKSIRAHHQVVMWHAIANHHACRTGAAVRTRFGGKATGGQRAGNASLATARTEKDALKGPEKEAPAGAPGQRRPVLAANLLIQQTAGDEDEEALEGVEHRKEVRHDQVGARGEVEDAKGPGEAEDDDQGKGGAHPDAEKNREVRKFPKNPTKKRVLHTYRMEV